MRLHFCLHPSPFARNADKQRDCKAETISLKLHPLSSSPTNRVILTYLTIINKIKLSLSIYVWLIQIFTLPLQQKRKNEKLFKNHICFIYYHILYHGRKLYK